MLPAHNRGRLRHGNVAAPDFASLLPFACSLQHTAEQSRAKVQPVPGADGEHLMQGAQQCHKTTWRMHIEAGRAAMCWRCRRRAMHVFNMLPTWWLQIACTLVVHDT